MTPVLVALAGSLGAVCRFVLDSHVRSRYNPAFPWATLLINISGSLLLGIIEGMLIGHVGMAGVATIVGAGFCGGYTTFSTASFETVQLLEKYQYSAAIANAFGGLLLAVAAAGIGVAIGLNFG